MILQTYPMKPSRANSTQFERRQQLDDLNASGRDDLTNTELKNVENLALKTSFDNVYRPNNKVRLDLGGTVSFYQIKGLYTDWKRQRAQIIEI